MSSSQELKLLDKQKPNIRSATGIIAHSISFLHKIRMKQTSLVAKLKALNRKKFSRSRPDPS